MLMDLENHDFQVKTMEKSNKISYIQRLLSARFGFVNTSIYKKKLTFFYKVCICAWLFSVSVLS